MTLISCISILIMHDYASVYPLVRLVPSTIRTNNEFAGTIRTNIEFAGSEQS